MKWRGLFHKPTETAVAVLGTQVSVSNQPSAKSKSECQELDWNETVSANRAVKRYPALAPPNPTAKAFATWMAAIGCSGEYLQDELFETYMAVCQLAGFIAMPKQAFGFAMRDAGCDRRRVDMRKRGKGRRVWVIQIPAQLPSQVPRVPKPSKSMPWPELKPGPGIVNGVYASVRKQGGASAIISRAA